MAYFTPLTSEQVSPSYIVVSTTANGKKFEVLISATEDGISAEIVRENEVCTEAGFDWDEKTPN